MLFYLVRLRVYLVRVAINPMSTSDDPNKPDDQAAERPIGVEEQNVIERQEAETEPIETEEPETTTSEEQVNRLLQDKGETQQSRKEAVKKEDSTKRMLNQFTRHFQTSRIASDKTINTLKQIQKQLTQIEKVTAVGNKQQGLVKQLTVQVRAMQKQLDKISSSVNRIKTQKQSRNSKKKK